MKILQQLTAFMALRQTFAMNTLRVAAAVQDGETVTFGSRVFEVDTHAVSTITAGRIRVDCSGGTTAAATKVLTLAANLTANDTITVGATVYTAKSALSGSNQILIGASASDTIDNLIAAINLSAGIGTLYGTGTVINASVTASAGAGDTMLATAKVPGTVGNAIAIAEAAAQASWAGGATNLSGGLDPTAGEFTTALQAAADSLNDIYAKRISANEVLFVCQDQAGPQALSCTETLAGANNAWAAVTTYGGSYQPDSFNAGFLVSRVPTAQEITLQTMHFYFPNTPTAALVQVRAGATGVLKAFDGAIVQDGRLISVNGVGSTDLAADDIVTLSIQ